MLVSRSLGTTPRKLCFQSGSYDGRKNWGIEIYINHLIIKSDMAVVRRVSPLPNGEFNYVPRSIIRDCCDLSLLPAIEDADPCVGFLDFIDEQSGRTIKGTELNANELGSIGISDNRIPAPNCDHVMYLKMPQANYCGACGTELHPIRELYERREGTLTRVVNSILGR